MGTLTQRSLFTFTPSPPNETMRSLLTLPLLWAAGTAADFVSVSTFNELKSKVQACDGTTLELRITSDIIVTEKLILSNACALTLSGVNSASGKVALDGAGKTGILMAMGGASLVAENIRFINGYDYYGGGAVEIYSEWTPGAPQNKALFKHCEFTNNIAVDRGGAVMTSGHCFFESCKFTDNKATILYGGSRGGAVYIGTGLDVIVDFIDTTFENNNATHGSDVYHDAVDIYDDIMNYDCKQPDIGYASNVDATVGVLTHCAGAKGLPNFTYATKNKGALTSLSSLCSSAPTACECLPVKGKYFTDTDLCTWEWCARAANEYYNATGLITDANSCETGTCTLGQGPGNDLVSCNDCTPKEYKEHYYIQQGSCATVPCTNRGDTEYFTTMGVRTTNDCPVVACPSGKLPTSDGMWCDDISRMCPKDNKDNNDNTKDTKDNKDNKDNKAAAAPADNTGAIVGAVVGVLAALAIGGVALWYFFFYKRRNSSLPKASSLLVGSGAPDVELNAATAMDDHEPATGLPMYREK